MTCLEAQKYFVKYINGELNIETLEQFLEHIHNCEDCKEELEVYYVMLIGMQHLEEDNNVSYDFHAEYLHQLKRSEEYLVHYKFQRIRRRILFVLTIAVMSLYLCLSSNYYTLKHPIYYKGEFEKSDYTLPIYFYKSKTVSLDQASEAFELKLKREKALEDAKNKVKE